MQRLKNNYWVPDTEQGIFGEPWIVGEPGIVREPGTIGKPGIVGEPGIIGKPGIVVEPGIVGENQIKVQLWIEGYMLKHINKWNKKWEKCLCIYIRLIILCYVMQI